jgi:antitoxin CcdA
MKQLSTKKATNLSISNEVLSVAKSFNINLSEAAEEGILRAVKKLKAQQWKIENQSALQSSNRYVAKHGLPLQSDRLF